MILLILGSFSKARNDQAGGGKIRVAHTKIDNVHPLIFSRLFRGIDRCKQIWGKTLDSIAQFNIHILSIPLHVPYESGHVQDATRVIISFS